jgi:hypothetical protein
MTLRFLNIVTGEFKNELASDNILKMDGVHPIWSSPMTAP